MNCSLRAGDRYPTWVHSISYELHRCFAQRIRRLSGNPAGAIPGPFGERRKLGYSPFGKCPSFSGFVNRNHPEKANSGSLHQYEKTRDWLQEFLWDRNVPLTRGSGSCTHESTPSRNPPNGACRAFVGGSELPVERPRETAGSSARSTCAITAASSSTTQLIQFEKCSAHKSGSSRGPRQLGSPQITLK